ncbi:hypothetical protein BT67DRAFT_20849 [Trichocladium antarcticum]|uniref:Uncharacterized protein n=1 Tax=Trichocladium antarcticum TaxID=1450529 RepID=A0AAN6ZHL9_9PEZI|nr:hypothetical protein BT67DRAFT_20849 [Trichocladium antarcticum]
MSSPARLLRRRRPPSFRARTDTDRAFVVQKKLPPSLSTMGKPPPHLTDSASCPLSRERPTSRRSSHRDVDNSFTKTAFIGWTETDKTTAPACARPVSPVMMRPARFSVSLRPPRAQPVAHGPSSAPSVGRDTDSPNSAANSSGRSLHCRPSPSPWVGFISILLRYPGRCGLTRD